MANSNPTTETEDTRTVKIVTRATYNNRKESGDINSNYLYIVLENTNSSALCMSMYLGLGRITDVISLNDINEGENFVNGDYSNLPLPNILAIRDKIYTYIDDDLNVVRAYMYKPSDPHTLIPFYGELVWQCIDDE